MAIEDGFWSIVWGRDENVLERILTEERSKVDLFELCDYFFSKGMRGVAEIEGDAVAGERVHLRFLIKTIIRD